MTHDHAAATAPAPAETGAPAPGSAPAAAPAAPDVPVWKLLAVLGGGGTFAGGLIVVAFQATQPRIQAHKALVLQRSVTEVLGGPEKFDTLYLVGDALTAKPPEGKDPAKFDRVYLGRRADGSRAGFAIVAAEPGFADDIRLIFGFDPEKGVVLGFKVLESKETPGLGDAIEKKEAYVRQFAGKEAPLVPVKPGASRGDLRHEVETITGATISSACVVRIINHAVDRWAPHLRAFHEEGDR